MFPILASYFWCGIILYDCRVGECWKFDDIDISIYEFRGGIGHERANDQMKLKIFAVC